MKRSRILLASALLAACVLAGCDFLVVVSGSILCVLHSVHLYHQPVP